MFVSKPRSTMVSLVTVTVSMPVKSVVQVIRFNIVFDVISLRGEEQPGPKNETNGVIDAN